jgi:GNAT superfamily N-acetyltransferase
MHLRAFQPEDLMPLHSLVVDTIDACYPSAYPPRAVEFFKAYHSQENIQEEAARGLTFVGVDGMGICVTGTLFGAGIKRVFVHPRAQGRGHGREVMRALELKAIDQGLREVTLDASLVSIDFYRSLDYSDVSWEAHDVGGGQALRYLVMRKPL